MITCSRTRQEHLNTTCQVDNSPGLVGGGPHYRNLPEM
jgi:hypothetical protein